MNPLMPDMQDLSFGAFSDAYLHLHRLGKAPSIEEVASAFPHLSDEIRDKLPTIVALERTLQCDREDGLPKVDPTEPVGGCFVGDEIGRGSSGIVYRAYQPEFDREVAVKAVLLKSQGNGSTTRFQLERKVLAKLEHPNIVPVYSCTQSDQQAYLIMKLVEGHSFAQLISGDCDYYGAQQVSNLRYDWGAFAQLAFDIVSALEHSHQNGFVHRDIKPSNLMLDRDGKVWITDFGLVKILDLSNAMTETGEIIGTPRYISPEQLRGECDWRSDIYSLGMTLFEIATGDCVRKISEGLSPTQEQSKIDAIRTANPEIPEDLAFVIQKACAFNPADRYQTTTELKHVLARFVDGKKADRRTAKRDPNSNSERFYRKPILFSAAAACAAFACAAVLMFYQQPTRPETNSPRMQPMNFLEHLATNEDKDISEVVRDFTRDSMEAATEELSLSKSQASNVVETVDDFLVKLESRNALNQENLESAIKQNRNHHLFKATEILGLYKVVERSKLAPQEVDSARQLIKKFANLVARQKLSTEQSSALLSQLSSPNKFSLNQLQANGIDTQRLRNWFGMLDSAFVGMDYETYDLKAELNAMLNETVETVSAQNTQAAVPRHDIISNSEKISSKRPRPGNSTQSDPYDMSQEKMNAIRNQFEQHENLEEVFNRLPPHLRDRLEREFRK